MVFYKILITISTRFYNRFKESVLRKLHIKVGAAKLILATQAKGHLSFKLEFVEQLLSRHRNFKILLPSAFFHIFFFLSDV